MRAAKVNSSKADPFALLGVWYEIQKDMKRALGCHQKALLIDPTHPVSGRGVLRIKSYEEVSELCDAATKLNSCYTGWAWRSIGNHNAGVDDEMAIYYLNKALRCRDIDCSDNTLNVFRQLPSRERNAQNIAFEYSETCASLAECYRRLSKFTSSLRAYNAAFDTGVLDTRHLCSWAEVLLELGEIDEATTKFDLVLIDVNAFKVHDIAAYGFTSCMLLIAKRDVEEGKFGAALKHLTKGEATLSRSSLLKDTSEKFISVWKLLGDLYSYGYLLPSSVFIEEDLSKADEIKAKLYFITKGADAYFNCLEIAKKAFEKGSNPEHKILISNACRDVGTNFYLQSRVLSCELWNDGSSVSGAKMVDMLNSDKSAKSLYNRALEFVLKSIECNKIDAQTWLCLGCILFPIDPILSQHALCRSLSVNKFNVDAWSNLCLLYIEYECYEHSREAIDFLTQVADTSFVWICRGMLFERLEVSNRIEKEQMMCRASDSYRNALHMSSHPSARLGLSLTCRRVDFEINKLSTKDMLRQESLFNILLYSQCTFGNNAVAKILTGLMNIEQGEKLRRIGHKQIVEELHERGINTFASAMSSIDNPISCKLDKSDDYSQRIVNMVECNATFKSHPTIKLDRIVEGVVRSNATVREYNSVQIHMNPSLSDMKQRVHEEPDNGELWLTLGKQLLKKITGMNHVSRESSDAVSSAIQRAKNILVQNTTNPRFLQQTNSTTVFHKKVVSRTIQAITLSDAFALSSWLSISPEENLNPDHEHGRIDLERALLLDPENRYARAQLQLTH